MLYFDDAAALGVAVSAVTADGNEAQEAKAKAAYAAGATEDAPFWRASIKFISDNKPPVLQPKVRWTR